MIETMLVLSTAHLRPETCNDWLPRAPFAVFQKGPCGWFVSIPDADPDDLPPDLAECIAQGRALRCDWLMFDRDAAELTILPTYAW